VVRQFSFFPSQNIWFNLKFYADFKYLIGFVIKLVF
jgi:hypothetical protein